MKQALTGDGGYNISTSHRIAEVRTLYPEHEETNWLFDKLETAITKMNRQFQFRIAGFFNGVQVYHYPTSGFLGEHWDHRPGGNVDTQVEHDDPAHRRRGL